MNNRMKLPYKILYYNSGNKNDYGTSGGGRTTPGVLGIGNAEELNMTPKTPEAAWNVSSTSAMHYISLGVLYSTDNGNNGGGYAAIAENPLSNKLLA